MENSLRGNLAVLARFAWCGLVALRLAQQQGVRSELQQHLFLIRWLASAQKHKRFPKSVASDIGALLALGKQQGVAAQLADKLNYLYHSSKNILEQQSDLYRLTYCINTLKGLGWCNKLILSHEGSHFTLRPTSGSTVYVSKALLENSYNEAGELMTPIPFYFSGDINQVTALLAQLNLLYQREPEFNGFTVLTLLPGHNNAMQKDNIQKSNFK